MRVATRGAVPVGLALRGVRVARRRPARRPIADGRVDVVYYLRYRDRIKIGTSANPRQRVASLPHDEVLAFERGGRLLEQRRHAQFADHRIAGTEWFESHEALVAHVAELSAGVDDPWAAVRSVGEPSDRAAGVITRISRSRGTAGHGQCSCVRSPDRSIAWSAIGLPHSGHAGATVGLGTSSYGPSGGGPMYGSSFAFSRSMRPAYPRGVARRHRVCFVP